MQELYRLLSVMTLNFNLSAQILERQIDQDIGPGLTHAKVVDKVSRCILSWQDVRLLDFNP